MRPVGVFAGTVVIVPFTLGVVRYPRAATLPLAANVLTVVVSVFTPPTVTSEMTFPAASACAPGAKSAPARRHGVNAR